MTEHHPKLKPPRFAQRFLRWYCKPKLLEYLEGDIEEDFIKTFQKSGARSARIKYTLDVLRFFRPFAIRKFSKTLNSNNMFKINSRIAFRNLAKNKLYSFINIAGLSVGIAAFLIIIQYITFQFSFDKYHKNADIVYRLQNAYFQDGEPDGISHLTTIGMSNALKSDIPEIEKISLFHPYYGGAVVSQRGTIGEERIMKEENIYFVEPPFLGMLDYHFLEGDNSALDEPNNILITKSTRDKYFGTNQETVLGKTLELAGSWASGTFIVSGVIEDVPDNSHFDFDFLVPISKVLEKPQYHSEEAVWGWSNFVLYAQISPNTTEQAAEAKMAGIMKKHIPTEFAEGEDAVTSLINIQDIHLKTESSGPSYARTADLQSVYFMTIIASFVLVIAWINFINLSTAKSSERRPEVGIKKAMGATRKQLVLQFLVEAFWINTIAIVLGVGLTYIFQSYLKSQIQLDLTLDFSNTYIIISMLGLFFLGPVLSGFYPAILMSATQAIKALKGEKLVSSSSRFDLRKILVVFQFVISALLIAGTFAVSRQLNFMLKNREGINLEQILVFSGPEVNPTIDGFNSFRNQVNSIAGVSQFSSSRSIPGAEHNFYTQTRRADALAEERTSIGITWVDSAFVKMFDIQMVSGRDFSESKPNQPNGIIINESSIDAFGLGSAENALNEKLIFGDDSLFIRGVMKNHHWSSLKQNYEPEAFLFRPVSTEYFSMKVTPQRASEIIEGVEQAYQSSFPGNPIDYFFLDNFFNKQYASDLAFLSMFEIFAVFVIFTSCLGLFGLASYTVAQKSKEIGIRKVLGASGRSITLLFSKSYFLLILIANLIAVPIAYFGIKDWLTNFAFGIPINLGLFIIPLIILMAIAGLTISIQTLKAARLNPAKNLRNE